MLADDGVLPFELGMPAKVLGSATDAVGEPLYEVKACTIGNRVVRAEGGFALSPAEDVATIRGADLVVVAPSSEHTALRPGGLSHEFAAVLERIPARARIASLCLASFVLAAAGELDGRRATTHWAWSALFASTFSAVRVDADLLYVSDGRVTTSAGAAAGIDMLLNIVREDHGSSAANAVARRCVVPAWREGGQLQYVDRPLPAYPSDSVGRTIEWASTRISQPIGLDALAAHANMSRRTFTRKFREATGMSAGDWLLRERIEQAKRLLETTDRPIEVVAHESGFGSGSSLRKHLLACTGLTPSAYRQTFHA